MQELKEVKFLRNGKEYILEKTEAGFNCKLVDFDDVPPIHRSFEQMLELSRAHQISFSGFEEKTNEAELLLINCMRQAEIVQLQKQAEELKNAGAQVQQEVSDLKRANEELQQTITQLQNDNNLLREAKELAIAFAAEEEKS